MQQPIKNDIRADDGGSWKMTIYTNGYNMKLISIIESIAQAENESRSDNIKRGIKQRSAQGTSKLCNRTREFIVFNKMEVEL